MMVATVVLLSKVMLCFVRAGKFVSEILVVVGCNTVLLILVFATNRLGSVRRWSCSVDAVIALKTDWSVVWFAM